jgi:hypothetical protein
MDHRKLRDSFLETLNAGEAVWDESGDRDRARRKTVAEDIFLRFVVGWESFISEWFIGAVNRDASRLRRHVEKQLDQWLQDAVNEAPYERYTVRFPRPVVSLKQHPTLSEVRHLLDPGGRNIEFRSFDELRARCHRQLAPRFAGRVQSLHDAGASEIVDASLSIRNVLAHRSQQSVQTMNTTIRAFPSYPTLRKERMSKEGLGTYLVAQTPGGEARLIVFKREFGRIGRVLVP